MPRPKKLRVQHPADQTGLEATHVLIGGIVFPRAEKAPYVMSGHSVLGGLEYNEEKDRVKCHKCGNWFRRLGRHLSQVEGISSSQYKRDHGLRQSTTLASA